MVEHPEINLVIESENITAKNRKLKVKWSYDAKQDLDFMQDFRQRIINEILYEIDKEILNDIRIALGENPSAAVDHADIILDKAKYEVTFDANKKIQQEESIWEGVW